MIEEQVAEDLMLRNEESQKILMQDLMLQQKNSIKSMNKKTNKSIDQWKKDIDRKLTSKTSTLASSFASSRGNIILNYQQLVFIVLLCFLVGKYV